MSGSGNYGRAGSMRFRKLIFLSAGHTVSDLYPGMLSPLLPLILERYCLSMAMAGVLVMVLQLFCNFSQPLVGIINERRPMKSLLWTGLIISAVPFCFLLKLGSPELMIIALAVSGIGVGMYHPLAAVAAGLVSRENRKGISMAVFSSGGLIGFMIAPVIVVVIVQFLDEKFMPIVLLPALIMAACFMLDRGIAVSENHHHLPIRDWLYSLNQSKRELFILWLVSLFRAVVQLLIGSFLPLLFIARGVSYAKSVYFLSITLFAAMIGMYVGGYLSDIHGHRKIMSISLFAATPLLFAFLITNGIVSTFLLLFGMAFLSSTIPVNIVLAQRAAPQNASMASSTVMGLSFGMASLTAWPFGVLAPEQIFHLG